MAHRQFLLRVAQSVAREYVGREDAERAGAALVDLALANWEKIQARYPSHCDDIALMEHFTAEALETPSIRALIAETA